MLALLAAGCYFYKDEVRPIFSRFRRILYSREWLLILLFAAAAAFYTSRGKFHTDTGIYHAQAIRLIEEYGTIVYVFMDSARRFPWNYRISDDGAGTLFCSWTAESA